MINKVLSRISVIFLYLLSLMPMWLLYLIADLLYILLFYLINYRKNVIRINLINSFPEKSLVEINALHKKYVAYLADLVIETIKMLSISEKEIKKRFKLNNPEILDQIMDKGQSICGVVGHYGNWEWAALITSFTTKKPKIIIYKPLNNNYFNDLFIKTRSRFGVMLVPMKGILRKLTQYRNIPALTVFASDQTPVKGETQFFTTFLNQQTAVFLGIEKIANLTNAAVVFCDIRILKRGYYECTFVPIVDNPKTYKEHEITELHVKYLDKVIQDKPQYWLWSHRRWKFKPEDL